MRKYIKPAVLAVSAVLLISGCGGNNTPSGTEREKNITTTSDTEEVTTSTTEIAAMTSETPETATAVTETTTKKTTTRPVETPATLPIPEGSRKYYIDDIFVPFDDKDFEIFGKAFCGVWTGVDGNGEKYGKPFTYSESPFMFENWFYPCGIIETDDYYAITYVGGGVRGCYFIEKSAPDVMYDKELWYDSDGAFVFVNDDIIHYTNRRTDDILFTPEVGKISVFGLLWLENEYGEDFRRVFEETIDEKHLHEGIEYGGRMWCTGNTLELDYSAKMYLVSSDDDTVKIGRTYLDQEEFHDRVYENKLETEMTVKTFTLTFSKSENGEWSLTGFEPYDTPEKEKE